METSACRWVALCAGVFLTISAGGGPVAGARPAAEVPADFAAFLARADAAQLQLQNGRADPYKALWSASDDVTLSGGFGGQIEKGWAAVSTRLDWVGTQFSRGTNRIHRVVEYASGDLGYLVQTEQLRYRDPAGGAETTRDYRVTMVFRKESGEWRIVHRQADSQLSKQGSR